VPLDEDVPNTPEVAYSLAKDLEEEMAAQFCRWDPALKMIGLRFSNVMGPADYAEFPSFESDPASRKWNLWSYIDARDGAQAAVRALAYDQPGFEAFIITADDTVMSTPSAQLMATTFSDVEFRATTDGTAALCSIDKARRQLGFTPRMRTEHTSEKEIGQIYIPAVNWALMIACIGLVVAFGSSSNLAAAYGVAVTTTMWITTLLLYIVAREIWGWSFLAADPHWARLDLASASAAPGLRCGARPGPSIRSPRP